ncbi:MAG: peptide chain release factor 2 [Nitrospirae bacterium CG2_30_53_67]|nr:MAG: peptide chain release factor 2 [Nitrospirae bacterium CG2_30_53_67]
MTSSGKKSRKSPGIITSFGVIFDLTENRNRLEEIEKRITDPNLWQDPQSAQKILKERTALQNQISEWENLAQSYEDLEALVELSDTEKDESLYPEIRQTIDGFRENFNRLELKTMLGEENDPNNAIVNIHSGAGGTESQDWAQMLLRMYQRWAENKRFKTTVLDLMYGEEAGIKNVTFIVEGAYAYGLLKAEDGVHRLVRISPFDAGKRRHTSFASVLVSPELDEKVEVPIREEDLRIDTFRSSGAGGQHVNVTDSAVRITHIPTGIVVQCQNERSQYKNKASAMKVMKARIYELEKKKEQERLEEMMGERKEIGWGSQIRSYVLQPYQLVKDLRTKLETGNVEGVLNGDIDEFINAFLLKKKK